MLHFNNSVTVFVCGRTPEKRAEGVEKFQRLFGNFTQTVAYGGWIGEQVVEQEEVAQVTAWVLPRDAGLEVVINAIYLAKDWQAEAEQEAVSIVLVHDGRWDAYILCDEQDYEELLALVEVWFSRHSQQGGA